jgi:hypothetical protein
MPYAIRLPRTGESEQHRWRTLAQAQEYVERVYAPRYTREPSVEIVNDAQHVVATWIVRDREWVR